jgi:hypothetical protein
VDTKPNYVTDADPEPASDKAGPRPLVVDRIKQALVTSRLTLASHSTGTDPYDSRLDRRRGSIWGNRRR